MSSKQNKRSSSYVAFDVGDEDHVTAYDLKISAGSKQELNLTLRYSRLTNSWLPHIRGKKAARLTDDGNGVRLRMQNVDLRLGYDDISRIMLLLELWAAAQPDDSLAKWTYLKEVSDVE